MNKSPTLDLESPVTDWIGAFNRAKGWKTLRGGVPKPEGDNLRASPKPQLREERKLILDGARKQDLTSEIAKDEATLALLDRQIAGLPADDDSSVIQTQRDDIAAQIAENKASLELIDRIDARVAQLHAVESDLSGDLKDTRQEIRDLQQQAGKIKFDPDGLDEKRLAEFRGRHVAVQGNIEKARAEVMSITTADGAKTRSYAIINSKEYKILFGMLEQAILLLECNDLDSALARVKETADKLAEYRNARTGATPIARPAGLHSDLDAPMDHARSMIDKLRDKGFAAAADALDLRHGALHASVARDVAAGKTDIRDRYLEPAQRLEEAAQTDGDHALAIEALLIEARTDIASMRANGHRFRPKKSDTEVAAFLAAAAAQPRMDMAEADAQAVVKTIRERLERTKAQDLRQAALSSDDIAKEVAALGARYDAMFKHKRDGSIRTQKDTKSREQKGIKKNSNLPRGALEEIELQVLAAKQLAASDSVDALKAADDYLAGVKNFLDAIDADPKIYKHLEDGFGKVEKAIGKIASSYPLYEPGKRLDLKAELDALRAGMLTRPQAAVEQDTDALAARVAAFRTEVQELQAKKRALAKLADHVDKIIEAIGKRLKKDQEGFVQFDGYYGPEVSRMMTVRDKIAERSPRSLAEAETTLIDMNANLGLSLSLLERRKDGKDLDDAQNGNITDLVSVARAGQLEHDANEQKKKEFKSGIDDLKDLIGSTEKKLKKLKADPSDITALEAERTGLKAEIEKTGKYIDGIDKLAGLTSRTNQIRDDAKAAANILDAPLADAANSCVQAIEGFVEKLDSFVADVIAPAGAIDGGGNQLDNPPFDRARINGFFTSLSASINKVDLAALRSQSAVVANGEEAIDKRKLARKTALQELRKLMALFDGFAPMKHFRSHPFAKSDASSRLVSARQALPRLEKRLLTAIKD